MKKVLITGVGNRDPFSEYENDITEGAVLTATRYFKPDYIYLMPSARKPDSRGNTYDKANECEKEIKEFSNSEVFIKPLDVKNVTDYKELKKAYQNNLKEIYSDFADVEIEFINSISSGTAQMETIWLILKNNGFLKGKVYKVIAPKFAENDNPALRIKNVVLDWFKEDNLINSCIEQLGRFSFENSAKLMKQLSNITTSERRKVFADIFSELFKGYALWDNLQYKLAFDKIKKAKREFQKFERNDVLEIIKKQFDFLGEIVKSDNETSDILLDLYSNLERRYYQNNYADALSRMWRIYEGFTFHLIRKNDNIEPLDLRKSQNNDLANQLIKNLDLKVRKGIYSLNREKVIFDIWKKKNSNEWKLLQKIVKVTSISGTEQKTSLFKILENLRELRNNSIIAHGLKPVSQQIGMQCLEISKELILLLDEIDNEKINKFSLNLENIKSINDFLSKLY